MQSDCVALLHTAVEKLVHALSSLTQAQLNAVPFEGSWTAGQATEHVLRSIEKMPGLFDAGSEPTTRDCHQHEAQIKTIFLDFSSKMQSPDFILPGDGPFYKDDLIDRLQATALAIDSSAAQADLTRTLLSFAFPGIGHLTGHELLCFAYCHTARHARQVQNITGTILEKAPAK